MTEKNDFKVEDMATADWCLEKIKIAENEIEKNNAYADMVIQKARDFKDDANKEFNNTIEFMQGHLMEYLLKQGKKKLPLINGQISFRKQQDSWEILKPDALVKTLESSELHDLVRIKKTPALSEIKKHLTVVDGKAVYEKTGEFVDGITVTERPDKFTYKTN